MLICQPYYLSRAFTSVFVSAVYIPPEANSKNALQELHEVISCHMTKQLAGDFNQADLRTVLPKFHRAIKNRHHLLSISSAFRLKSPSFLSSTLRNTYHLICIREGDQWKAFNTLIGHYECIVMPFGLTNAPAVFEGLVNHMLLDMLNISVFVNLDDIPHLLQIQTGTAHQVLQRHLENQLFIKAEKCDYSVFPGVHYQHQECSHGPGQSLTGPLPLPARSTNGSWGLPISSNASSGN